MQLKTYTGPLLLAWPNLSPDPRAIRKYTLLLSRIWGQGRWTNGPLNNAAGTLATLE